MIEIASNLASAWNSSWSTQKKQRRQLQHLADTAEEEAEKLRQQYEEKNAYLFRTAAEKTRLAYENARAQLAARQAKWAAQGLTGESASVADAASDIRRQTLSQQASAQAQLQTEAAQNEQEKKTAWQKLLAAASAYRREARKKSRWSALGKALGSLLN